MKPTYMVVLITTKDKQEAKAIAHALLTAKLIACANILSGIDSYFWWQGKIDAAEEVLLLVKSRQNLFKKITVLVKSLHSYDNPEIIALPIIAGHKPYLQWLKDSTA